MKRTQLWQAPGSPIIQGRSKGERPFWQLWLASVLLSEAILFATLVLINAIPGAGAQPFSSAVGGAAVVLVPAIPGAALGGAGGALLGRGIGWRHAWVLGGVLGALAGAASVWLIGVPLDVRGVRFL